MRYRIGNTIFEAEDFDMAIAYVKANSLAGKLDEMSGHTSKATTVDRKVTVTCVNWAQVNGKWSRSTHKWSGTIAEVSGQSCCPQHRK